MNGTSTEPQEGLVCVDSNGLSFPESSEWKFAGPAEEPVRRHEAARLLLVAVIIFGSCWLGMNVLRPGETLSAIWPANGVLLAFVITAPRRYWAAYFGVGLLANMAADWWHGGIRLPGIGLDIADMLEVGAAAMPFWEDAPRTPDLADGPTLVRFAISAGIVAPLVSASWMVVTNPRALAAYTLLAGFRSWVTDDALGLLLFTPLMLAFFGSRLVRLFSGKQLIETVGWLSMLSVTGMVVFRNDDFPFPFLLLVALIPVVYRLGPTGATLGVLVIAVPAIHYTFANRGPLARYDLLYWSLFLQLYLLILLVMVHVLSAVLAKEKRLADELRTSEQRYRMLAETSQDIILRTTLDGVRTYVSPAVQQVTGWKEEELLPPNSPSMLIHPDDRLKFEDFVRRLGTGKGSHSLVYRARKRDGDYGWLEAYVGAVYSRSSVPDELVWTIRDISLRVAHEELLTLEKQHAQTLAWTDGLTGLNNRRAFDERLAAELLLAEQHQIPLSLLLLDVDHFKSFNDVYGHQAGDECLRQIARSIGECTRQAGDMAARYGGEEFAVILPRADLTRAREVAERIRESMQQLGIDHSRSATGKATVSIGVSCTEMLSDMQATALIEAADRALYSAKNSGRNRIAVAS